MPDDTNPPHGCMAVGRGASPSDVLSGLGRGIDVSVRPLPILFTGAMVESILNGRKTQTRRVIKPKVYGGFIGGRGEEDDPRWWGYENGHGEWFVLARGLDGRGQYGSRTSIRCPYGEPGGELYVRETYALEQRLDDKAPSTIDPKDAYRRWYAASGGAGSETGPNARGRWRPSIHMPKWAARIRLRVKDVRVERLQAISEEDAAAEGVPGSRDVKYAAFAPYEQIDGSYVRPNFRHLWDEINAGRGFGWYVNPWVWVVDFERIVP